MAVFESIGHDLYCVDALYQQPRVASIYVLIDGDEAAIIETGTSHSLANVTAALAHLGIESSQVKYVIPTHVHLDHAGGAGAMMQAFSQATLIVHPRGATHLIDPARLIAATITVYGEQTFQRLYGNIEPVDEARILVADDEAQYQIGKRKLHFIDTPGHARHHFCIFDPVSRGVFSGDTFGLSYTPMEGLTRGLLPSTPPTQFDPPALRESIRRIMQFKPQRLYLTHYGKYENPAVQVDSFNRWIDEYIDLCRQSNPTDACAETRLIDALRGRYARELADAKADLDPVLAMDTRLNGQGLIHWWQRHG